ncbi:hypothetical protein RSOLAG1IB_02370 [Rhizoctonia solani AG-1 IB]|uniref:DUF7779 domain-containing protein n=1 Tax=Thanatephorus cucumeris (strain AG1-IB / isolate 7/3/14) TaxID=1108050 RepID=A0A0B7FNA1_THACB|nr:hypothetical protein RSOLAG1IB_02370 [Rhizoctonia solani AG-1 IB]
MLWLMAFLHHDLITEEIFERAATNLSLDPKARIFLLPPTETLINAYIHVEEYLSQFLDHTGRWDSLQFLNVINEIASYSLIDSDRTNSTFSIHILVQDWAKTKIEQDLEMATECTAVLLSLSIGFSDSSESRGFMADLEVHLNHFLSQQKQANVKDYHRQFSRAYCELERWQKAKELETNIYEEMKRIRGEKHIYTLGCMTNLASLFLNAGHFSMAETLQTNVLNIQREVLGPEHSHTIRSVTNLASIYLKQGRWDEVECLQLQAFSSGSNDSITKSSTGSVALLSDQRVIGILGPVLTEDSWNMLRGKTNLALAYLNQGRLNEAEILQAEVLCTYQRIFTREGPHPDMIISMINLASIYSRQARWGEAEKLKIEIIELQEALFGREDSRTLTSTAELGAIYSKQGRWAEAEVLQWEITKSYTALLGAGHPDTLCIKTELGVTYAGQQRWDEAEELQLLVLNMRLQQLGEYHQETLRNMSELVSIYMNKYQWAMAEEMQKRLLTARNYKQESAEDGSNVLLDTERMAKIYTELGQLTKAEALCAKALAIQAKAFGKISSDTQALIQDIQHRTRLNRQRFPVRSLLCVTAELGKSMYAKMPTANIGSRGSFAWIMLIVLLVLLHYPCISKRQVETELPKSPAGLVS